MLSKPFIRMVVLSCVAFGAGCGGGDAEHPNVGATANTEINLLISDPTTASEDLLLLIDFASYRIVCPDSPATPYYDSADIIGNFEMDETRDPPIWEMVSDLPLSTCSISVWVFYDNEVICFGTKSLPIIEDADNKVDVVMECVLSFDPLSGDLDVDASFDVIHGNYCPHLIWLGAVPPVVDATVPAETNLEAYAFDPDFGCGLNCDPRTCDFTTNPPTCSVGPDPGFSAKFYAPAGNGTFVDVITPNLNEFKATYACDLLSPGPTEICVIAKDGANECDKIRCTTVICPDLCKNGCPDDGKECTRDVCDPLDGSCSYPKAPPGIACDNCDGTCDDAGVCTGVAWTAANEFDSDVTGAFTIISTLQWYTATLVNPYSGASVLVDGNFRLNTSSYNGIGVNDILVGITMGGNRSEVLLIEDPVGTQTVCGVETLRSLNGFDVMDLAHGYIILDDMVIEGGTSGDILWANAGDDFVLGEMGPDNIDGGLGNDRIDGGEGDDTITLWPGSGFDSITGGNGIDTVDIDAIQSQILIKASGMGSAYEFDVFYYQGTQMAEFREVEFLSMNDAVIDLSTCTGGPSDVCNLCGNDALNGGEGCDDGNNVDGDGCTFDCTAEY